MAEGFWIALGVLVVASLAAIVGYFLAFLAAAAWTLRWGARRDPLAAELDAFLAGLFRQ
jgi:type IV secretory pathway TrbD component